MEPTALLLSPGSQRKGDYEMTMRKTNLLVARQWREYFVKTLMLSSISKELPRTSKSTPKSEQTVFKK